MCGGVGENAETIREVNLAICRHDSLFSHFPAISLKIIVQQHQTAM